MIKEKEKYRVNSEFPATQEFPGFRPLQVGEIIQDGDWISNLRGGISPIKRFIGEPVKPADVGDIYRPIPAPQPAEAEAARQIPAEAVDAVWRMMEKKGPHYDTCSAVLGECPCDCGYVAIHKLVLNAARAPAEASKVSQEGAETAAKSLDSMGYPTRAAEIRHLYASFGPLVKALEAVKRWHGVGMDSLEHFEDIGHMFYADTGYLRPGKSEPMATWSEERDKERQAKWREWCERKNKEIDGLIASALSAAGGAA